MKTLLQINTSLFGTDGNSSQLANRYAQQWQQKTGGKIVHRQLDNTTMPHLDAATFQAFSVQDRNAGQQALVALSDALIAELQQADEIVLAVPMYNFGIPSALKAYFDHIARAGQTFKYTSTGPVGLLQNKPITIMAARGGQYLGTAKDTQTGYLKNFLAFIGLHDQRFIYAENLARGGDLHQQSLAAATQQINNLSSAA